MRAYLAIIALAVAACSSSPAATAGPVATPAPSSAPAAATSAPTLAATVAPTATAAAAGGSCIVSTPTQVGTDMTPVVVQFDGYTAAQCAAALVLPADASDFAKANPPTRLAAPPSGAPVCTKSLGGVTVSVWGTAAAQVACAAMK